MTKISLYRLYRPEKIFIQTREEKFSSFFSNHQAVRVGIMTKISRLFIVLLFAGLIGSVIFLTTLNIPAPSSQVEKVISDDKFPH